MSFCPAVWLSSPSVAVVALGALGCRSILGGAGEGFRSPEGSLQPLAVLGVGAKWLLETWGSAARSE